MCAWAWVKLLSSDGSVEQHGWSINRHGSSDFFPLRPLFSHPILFLFWSLNTGAEGSVFHGGGNRKCVCGGGGLECVGMWCVKEEGTQVHSQLSTSQGILQHTWPLMCLYTECFCMSSYMHSKNVHHCTVLMCVSDDCAHVCASVPVDQASLSAWLRIFCGALICEWSWRLLLTLISPEILFLSPRSLFISSCARSLVSFPPGPTVTKPWKLDGNACTEVTLSQSRPKFSKSHSGAWL